MNLTLNGREVSMAELLGCTAHAVAVIDPVRPVLASVLSDRSPLHAVRPATLSPWVS